MMEISAVEEHLFRMPDGAQKFLCLDLSRQVLSSGATGQTLTVRLPSSRMHSSSQRSAVELAVCDSKCLLLARVPTGQVLLAP